MNEVTSRCIKCGKKTMSSITTDYNYRQYASWNNTFKCGDCGKEKNHASRGLCSTCYNTALKQKKKLKLKTIPKKWEKWGSCKGCKSADKKYHSTGYCKPCYHVAYRGGKMIKK